MTPAVRSVTYAVGSAVVVALIGIITGTPPWVSFCLLIPLAVVIVLSSGD